MMSELLSEKTKQRQTKELKQHLSSIRQQALEQGRTRFFDHGEIAEFSVDIKVVGKIIKFFFRYDPLNDAVIPLRYA